MNKDDLHRKVDDTVNNIIKNFGNFIENVRFNDTQLLEETNNLELATSVDQIGTKLSDLLKIVNEMKIEYLKKPEYVSKKADENNKIISEELKKANNKILILQENFNYTSSLLKEWKSSKYYRYAQSYNKIN
jgi:translation initiation factor 2 alpha subunit (eIF-2alpha)